MKKSLKLNFLRTEVLSPEEKKHLTGGACMCACCYRDCGGSSIIDNANANADDNLYSGSCYPCPPE